MSILPTPTLASEPRTKDAKKVAIFYALILVVLAVAQLYSFDTFLELMTSFDFPGGRQFAYFTTSFLVACEVFALPFLLRMPLSRAFRWVSMVAGWLVALIWIKVTLWLVITNTSTNSVGYLGTVLEIMPGWWAVFISISFAILAAWASWGLWPGRRKK